MNTLLRYDSDRNQRYFIHPSQKMAGMGVVLIAISIITKCLECFLCQGFIITYLDEAAIATIADKLQLTSIFTGNLGTLLFVLAALAYVMLPDTFNICLLIKRGLFVSETGNPLSFKAGELLPEVSCRYIDKGKFELTISAVTVTIEALQDISSVISSSLTGKYDNFAVIETNSDMAFNAVTFTIQDVSVKRELVINSLDELFPADPTKLTVQNDKVIDLTSSGSILVAGKTRSGKTTGVISLLLQVLLCGQDSFNSLVIIVDPKKAELSQLPHTVTLGENGETNEILDVIRLFEGTMKTRQRLLNKMSEQSGNAEKWHEHMKPSFLFIDEYISLRSMLLKRTKDNAGYSLDDFDELVKRIITMGASAGCFVILSVAEASVNEGGLPSMLKSACSTKILFRPTLPEARLIWDSEKLKNLNERAYTAGDAWFSSSDGVNDSVTNVHFPIMEFEVYRELGNALKSYYRE